MFRPYIELTKPRIIELLLITTVPAMAVAADGWPGLSAVIFAVVGGTLSAGGANVINQVYDRDIDEVMARTAQRPIPTDRVTPGAATAFGLVLGVLGSVILWFGTTPLASVLAAGAFSFYVFIYTMLLKRTTTQNIVIGGAAGAMPALIGWAAVTSDLGVPAFVMFAIVFFWTPPHFWALSLKYKDDYEAAGVPMFPVVAGEEPTHAQIVSYSLVTFGVSLFLVPVSTVGIVYAVAAVVSGVAIVYAAMRVRSGDMPTMRFFGWTNVYLAVIFLAMFVDRVGDAPGVGGYGVWAVSATILMAAGLVGIVVVERRPSSRVAGSSALRHTFEVMTTIVFALAIVAVSFISLGD